MPPIAYVMLVLWPSAVAVIGIVLWRQWAAARPRVWISLPLPIAKKATAVQPVRVGIRYATGATQPWEGLGEALDVAYEVLREVLGPEAAAKVMDGLWFDVLPHDAPVIGCFVPTGTVLGEDGQQHAVTGTINTEDFFVGTVIRRVVKTRQALDAARRVLPAGGADAGLHEIPQHMAPWVLEGHNANYFCKRPDPPNKWATLEAKMMARLAERRSSTLG